MKEDRKRNPMYPYIGPTYKDSKTQLERTMATIHTSYFIGIFQSMGIHTLLSIIEDDKKVAKEVAKLIKENHPDLIKEEDI